MLQGLHQVVAGGVNRCLHPVCGAGFGEDVGDVASHGIDADEQLSGDLRVVLSHGKMMQNLSLTLGKLMRKYGEHVNSGWRLDTPSQLCPGAGQQGKQILFFIIGKAGLV